MRGVLPGQRDVHSVNAGHEGGDHQDDRDRGESFYRSVYLIGNDGGKRVGGVDDDAFVNFDGFDTLNGLI